MKNFISIILIATLCMSLVACGDSSKSEKSSEKLTAEGLLQAFKDAGMPVIDDVIYTSATDPNEKLGRPGEYIAKINFNDADFYENGEDPILTIEVFSSNKDMKKRRDYIQGIVDSATINAFKNYIYDNGVFLLRVPYDVTPEVAEEYAKIFNDYLK